jgi:hypothetical protein
MSSISSSAGDDVRVSVKSHSVIGDGYLNPQTMKVLRAADGEPGKAISIVDRTIVAELRVDEVEEAEGQEEWAMPVDLRERRRSMWQSLTGLSYPEYLKALLVLLQELRRLNAGQQEPVMDALTGEILDQLRCAVTPDCEPADGDLADIVVRFRERVEALLGPAKMGTTVLWQALDGLLAELTGESTPYQAAQHITGAVYYHFFDPGTERFVLSNPHIELADHHPLAIELDRFADAIRRTAAGDDPDEVYAAVFN